MGFSPIACCLFPHPVLVFENAVFCGGDGQCPRKIDPMDVAVWLLFDESVEGKKFNMSSQSVWAYGTVGYLCTIILKMTEWFKCVSNLSAS